jgi:large conductance mechanosensitive channel
MAFTVKEAVGDKPAVLIKYGSFINTLITFIIVAFCIFMMVKAINRMNRKKEEAPAAPPAPTKEVVLLTEIRDALRTR